MKNIKVSDESWKNLMMIKYELGKSSVSEVIDELLKIHRRTKRK